MPRPASLPTVAALLAAAAGPAAAGSERSCAAEVGARRAAAYVEHCIQVSPATRPPCNAANPCSLIVAEIRRGCGLIADAGPPRSPGFCAAYADDEAGRR